MIALLAAPPHTQPISDTAQPATSLFVRRVDGAGALFTTLYGAALIAKLVAALIAIGLALGWRAYGELWRWRRSLMRLMVGSR